MYANNTLMKIAISAAETSGDLIGAKLVSALKAQNSDIQIEGMARILIFNNSCLVMVDSNSASTASLKPCCPTITIDLRVCPRARKNFF
jgi:lipid-A-disaccharide synthase